MTASRSGWRRRLVAGGADDQADDEPLKRYADSGPAVEDQVVFKRDLDRWRGLMDDLPGYCKSVLGAYMEYRLGLLESYREIARRVGRPLNTVSVQIKRCLEQLRQVARRAGIMEPH
jgi:DNA-directed RNA polymerase specialized sigma24 family protein